MYTHAHIYTHPHTSTYMYTHVHPCTHRPNIPLQQQVENKLHLQADKCDGWWSCVRLCVHWWCAYGTRSHFSCLLMLFLRLRAQNQMNGKMRGWSMTGEMMDDWGKGEAGSKGGKEIVVNVLVGVCVHEHLACCYERIPATHTHLCSHTALLWESGQVTRLRVTQPERQKQKCGSCWKHFLLINPPPPHPNHHHPYNIYVLSKHKYSNTIFCLIRTAGWEKKNRQTCMDGLMWFHRNDRVLPRYLLLIIVYPIHHPSHHRCSHMTDAAFPWMRAEGGSQRKQEHRYLMLLWLKITTSA